MKRITHGGLIAALVALTAGSVPMLAGPAQASFPGANGWIAFVSDRDSPAGGPINDEVYVIDENGTSKRLTNHPAIDSTAAVSPNGKEVAFTSNRNDAAHPNPEGDFEIYVMDINDDDGDGNGDNLRRITNDAIHEDAVAWSPDGRKLAFNCLLAAFLDICVMDAEGSEPPVNLTSDSPLRDGEPVFSPDGTKIAFHSRRLGGPNQIFMMNADGSDPTRITYSLRGNIDAEFSPDGTMLTFASDRDGDPDIYVMKAEPESAVNVPVNLTNASPVFKRWPTWSPDGTKIAFWSGGGQGFGPDAEIYLIDPDGTNLTNLTNTWGGDAFPDWGRARTKGPQ